MTFNLEKLTIFTELSWEGQKCKKVGRNLKEFKIFKFVVVSRIRLRCNCDTLCHSCIQPLDTLRLVGFIDI